MKKKNIQPTNTVGTSLAQLTFNKFYVFAGLLLFAVVGSVMAITSYAATTFLDIEAETLSMVRGAKPAEQRGAREGKVASLPPGGLISSSAILNQSAVAMEIRYKAPKCDAKFPELTVAMDGATIATIQPSDSDWQTHTIPIAALPGQHSFSVSNTSVGCSTPPLIDSVGFKAARG